MELVATQKIAAPRDKVWAALFDPEILKQCVPGCDSLEATGENQLTAKVTLRVGPVKASFSGRITLSDLVPPESCTLAGEGQGGVAGFARGNAKVRLSEDEPGTTLLSYEAKADVGGKLAQLGGRLIDSTARKLAAEFFTNFSKIVVPQLPAEVATPIAAEGEAALGSEPESKRGWLGGIFGKSSAALPLALGLLVPSCCLDGSHAHQFGAEPFGLICRGR
jgi:carbon monoxide dehydrogenase subunit G